MALFKIFKGTEEDFLAKRTQATNGYCYFVEDTGKMYIDIGDGSIEENPNLRVCLNAEEADRLKKKLIISSDEEVLVFDGSSDIEVNIPNKLKKNLTIINGEETLIFDGSSDVEINIPQVEDGDFLPLTGGTLTGPLMFTENIGYGTVLPENPVEGQIFFLDKEEGEISYLPEGGEAGQYLVKNSEQEGDASWVNFPIDIAELYSLIGSKASTAFYTGTLISDGWSSSAPYSQTITVSGLLSTDTPFVDIDLADVSSNQSATIEGWGLVGRVTVTADNEITAYCYEEKPTVNLPMVIKVVR